MSKLVELPNIRRIFVPDEGYTLYDADLAGADAQVVAWEAEDDDLKAAFRNGLDVHAKNAEDMLGSEFTRHPKDSFMWNKIRKQNKVAVHLTNYGGSSRTLAISLGWLVADADHFQKRWFSLHPGVKKNFHRKVESALMGNKRIVNAFGYHRIFFSRIEESFAEALAWIPQSTVALVSFKGALKLEKTDIPAELLLQVHDSLVFQIPSHLVPSDTTIKNSLAVPVPYDDPLIIPWGLKKSNLSWGDCK